MGSRWAQDGANMASGWAEMGQAGDMSQDGTTATIRNKTSNNNHNNNSNHKSNNDLVEVLPS